MANPVVGELAFEAGGRSYKLQYTHSSLIELEQELGKGIVGIISELQSWAKDPERIRLGWVRALLWAGLRRHHPDISLVAAGEMITDIGGIGETIQLIGEALTRAFPPEMKGSRPMPQKQNGAGTDSTQSTSALAMTEIPSGPSLPVSTTSGD